MNHLTWDELWALFDDEPLTDIAALRDHVRTCTLCAERCRRLKSVDKALRVDLFSTFEPPSPETDFVSDVMSRLKEKRTGSPFSHLLHRNMRVYRFVGAFAGAAMLVGAGLAYHFTREPSRLAESGASTQSMQAYSSAVQLPSAGSANLAAHQPPAQNGRAATSAEHAGAMAASGLASAGPASAATGTSTATSASADTSTASSTSAGTSTATSASTHTSTAHSASAGTSTAGSTSAANTAQQQVSGQRSPVYIRVSLKDLSGQPVHNAHVAVVEDGLLSSQGVTDVLGEIVLQAGNATAPVLSGAAEATTRAQLGTATIVVWKGGFHPLIAFGQTIAGTDGNLVYRLSPLLGTQESSQATFGVLGGGMPTGAIQVVNSGDSAEEVATLLQLVNQQSMKGSTNEMAPAHAANMLSPAPMAAVRVDVVDNLGRPVPAAEVTIASGDQVRVRCVANQNGTTGFLRAIPANDFRSALSGNAQSLPQVVSLVVEKPGYRTWVGLYLPVSVHKPAEFTVRLRPVQSLLVTPSLNGSLGATASQGVPQNTSQTASQEAYDEASQTVVVYPPQTADVSALFDYFLSEWSR